MYYKARAVILTILAGAMFTGCASDYYSKVPEPFTSNVENQEQDSLNYQKKLQKLVNKQFPKSEVKLVADHFNVLIVGQVESQEAKGELYTFVKHQHDSREVFNYVSVQQKPSLNYSSSLTAKVQDRLVKEQDMDADKVTVVVVDGVVYLMGTNIGDLTHLARAIVGLYTIDGVDKVVNLVKPGVKDYYSTYTGKP